MTGLAHLGDEQEILGVADTEKVRADRLVDLLNRLQAASVALNRATDPREVARATLEQLTAVIPADSSTVRRLTADGDHFELLASTGHPPRTVSTLQRHPADKQSGFSRAVQTKQPVFLESPEALQASGLSLHTRAAGRFKAWAVLPLIVDDAALGGVGLSCLTPHEFSAEERTFAMVMAQQCAIALHRLFLRAEEQAAKAAIEAEHARLQQIVDVIPLGVAVVRDGHYVLQNTAATTMMGGNLLGFAVPASEPLQYRITRPSGEHYVRGGLPLERSLATGEVIKGEQLEITLPGLAETRTLPCSSTPLWDDEHHMTGAVAVLDDISQLKLVERRRSLLVAKMMHDARNPLAAIRLLGTLAERQGRQGRSDPVQLANHFRTLQSLTARSAAILSNVTQMMRQELGVSLQLTKTQFDLCEMAQTLVSDYQLTTDLHQLRFVAPAAPVMGSWDRQALQSALDNLISNAIKYSPEGGPIIVRVDAYKEGDVDWAKLSVQDSGTGIATEDLPHIFETFYRAADTAGIEGTGLGLSAVKDIVEGHGGKIEAQSELGHGSIFSMYLPLDDAK